MTSKITRKTYDAFTDNENKYCTLNPFYITGKSGTVRLEKYNEHFAKFKFTWFRKNTSKYVDYCVSNQDKHNQIYFFFSSFDELSETIDKQNACLNHSTCDENNCSAYRITSPIEKCAICLKDVQMHMLEETECEHLFCLKCLDSYVKSRLRYNDDDNEHIIDGGIPCPVCRRDLHMCEQCGYARFDCICDGCTCNQ